MTTRWRSSDSLALWIGDSPWKGPKPRAPRTARPRLTQYRRRKIRKQRIRLVLGR